VVNVLRVRRSRAGEVRAVLARASIGRRLPLEVLGCLQLRGTSSDATVTSLDYAQIVGAINDADTLPALDRLADEVRRLWARYLLEGGRRREDEAEAC
jgi:hypothetical protein